MLSGEGIGKRGRECRLTVTIGEADGECLGLRLALADIGADIPDPASIAADVGGELHVRRH